MMSTNRRYKDNVLGQWRRTQKQNMEVKVLIVVFSKEEAHGLGKNHCTSEKVTELFLSIIQERGKV